MNSVRTHIGVDVGKDWLDICYPDGQKEHVRNIKSCRTKLIKKAMKLDAIVSFEATGPYEEPLAEECLAKGVKAVRLDAWGARQYAKSQGFLEKTDKIDCEMIRDYAGSLRESRLHYVKPRSEAQKRLKKAIGVRKNLQKAKSIVFNQLEHVRDPEIKKQITSLLTKLEKEIDALESECDSAIAGDERMQKLYVSFQEMKGVGPCTARAMLAHCPDIGEFTKGGIAKYCGVGPLENKSCTIVKKSKPKRGRADLKQALHMAAVNASRSNHVLRPIYQRLLANGKDKMVALQAVARHIAITLNTIAKYPDFKLEQDPKEVEHQAKKRNPGRSRKVK